MAGRPRYPPRCARGDPRDGILFNVSNSSVADKAVDQARNRLADRAATVFHYGAVDIDPKHLVVWVLLSGAPDHIPAWYFPHRDPVPRSDELLAEIHAMRAIVVDCFADSEWPDAEHIHVGFDSSERVAANGGWHYFK